jgi:hypothetical protein
MPNIILPSQLIHPILEVRPQSYPGSIPRMPARLDEGREPVALDDDGPEVFREDLGIELLLVAEGEEIAMGLGIEEERVEMGDEGWERGC